MALVKNWQGSWGLPDIGATEKLADIFGLQRTAQGGSSFRSMPAAPIPMQPINYSTVPVSMRQSNVLGTTSSSMGGGGPAPSSTGISYTPPQDLSNLYEPTPSQPDFEAQYGNAFNEVLSALDQREAARQSGYGADVSQIEAGAEKAKGTITGQLAEAQANLTGQAQRETGRTEAAQNQVRRQYSEVQQGLQSLYGGTTGTGRFATELAGRESMRLIGSYGQAMNETLSDIDRTRTNVINESNQRLLENDQSAQSLKLQAKAQLDQDISELRSQKAMLGVERQRQIVSALQNYQSLVASINQRNLAFRQQLYMDQQQFAQKLQEKKIAVSQNYVTQLQQALPGLIRVGAVNPSYADEYYGLPAGTFQLPAGGGKLTPDDEKQKTIENIANSSY